MTTGVGKLAAFESQSVEFREAVSFLCKGPFFDETCRILGRQDMAT